MSEQTRVWNDVVGDAWVRHAHHFDRTLEPFGEAAMGLLDLRPGTRVLDIGCGTGQTTVALAERVAPGLVVGVDLSATMLGAAQGRADALGAANVDLRLADAEHDRLVEEPVDAAFSRFGVMFFADPVAAFANVATAVVEDGELAFVCFQGAMDNPFIALPVLAAAAHLGVAPPMDPEAPGPFALADPERIRGLLAAAGWSGVAIEPGPSEAALGGADDLSALARRVLEQNPTTAPAVAGGAGGAPATAVAAAVGAVTEVLAPYVDGSVVRMAAGTWLVHARRAPRR